jgi:hypothetical protein
MGMRIDEPRAHYLSPGIDHLESLAGGLADFRNESVFYGDISEKAGDAGTVHDRAILD